MEVQKFWDEADIVCTNPPFSIIPEFYAKILNKKFSTIGNNLDIVTEKDILIREINNDNMFIRNHSGNFITPNGETVSISKHSILWFTNLIREDKKRKYDWQTVESNLKYNKKLQDFIKKHGMSIDNYPKTDDGDFYVPIYSAIPIDYYEEMIVPISYLNAIDRKNFIIIGKIRGATVNGKELFQMLRIKRRIDG